MELLNTVFADGDKVITAVFTVHAAALAIANLTPTPKDNVFLKRTYKVIEVFAGFWTVKSKL